MTSAGDLFDQLLRDTWGQPVTWSVIVTTDPVTGMSTQSVGHSTSAPVYVTRVSPTELSVLVTSGGFADVRFLVTR